MKNTSKSLQKLNEDGFDMPNGLMSCNFNAESVRQAPQCDIYDGLCLRTYRNLALVGTISRLSVAVFSGWEAMLMMPSNSDI